MPWCLPDGDKTCVQLATPEENDNRAKPKVGTLYTVIKPLEKAASQKGSPLTLTSYGKIEAKGAAGKHGYVFEFPDIHPSTLHRTISWEYLNQGQHPQILATSSPVLSAGMAGQGLAVQCGA